MTSPRRFALLASTGASVARIVHAFAAPGTFALDLVVTDRACGAEAFADAAGIPRIRVEGAGRAALSDAILAALRSRDIEIAYVFFTRILEGALLEAYRGRLVNFHPSLLPACPGKDGFGDSVRSGALWIGTTVHLVDAGTDTGPKLLQSVLPASGRDPGALRHEVFAHQCAALYQAHRWIAAGHLVEDGFGGLPPARGEHGFVPDLGPDALAMLDRARALQRPAT